MLSCCYRTSPKRFVWVLFIFYFFTCKTLEEYYESHSSASEHLNKEEEDRSTVPMATPKTVLSIQMSKHKTHLKQNVIISH